MTRKLVDNSRRLGAAVLLAAGFGLTIGCGDDDGDAGKASTAPAETSQRTQSAGRAQDACGLLTSAEVAAQLRGRATRERKSGSSLDGHPFSQCRWTAGKRKIGVVVVASTARYETQRKLAGGQRTGGLGDAAVAREGTSLETTGGTGGRTVAIKDGDRSLVVALDLGGTVGATFDPSGSKVRRDDPVSTADVVALARKALGRLR